MNIATKITKMTTVGIAAFALTACEKKIEKCYDISKYIKAPCEVCFMAYEREEPVHFRTETDPIPMAKYGSEYYSKLVECRSNKKFAEGDPVKK